MRRWGAPKTHKVQASRYPHDPRRIKRIRAEGCNYPPFYAVMLVLLIIVWFWIELR